MEKFENLILDEERALYGLNGAEVISCKFDGPADGESAFKECRDVKAVDCYYNLRYPFWHDDGLEISGGEMTELCRAALWYSKHIKINNCVMHGIKALRECSEVEMDGCDVISPEFGWNTNYCTMKNSKAEGEYFMFGAKHLKLDNVQFKGKYSFQYVHDLEIDNCYLDTKDAFWHSHNVTVRNSVVKGEYLAWYSDHLTLINCKIIGTQPLCYCANLKLIDCEMIDTDLSFEKSEVEATLTAPIISIKNPLKGYITVPECGEVIIDDEVAKLGGCKLTIG